MRRPGIIGTCLQGSRPYLEDPAAYRPWQKGWTAGARSYGRCQIMIALNTCPIPATRRQENKLPQGVLFSVEFLSGAGSIDGRPPPWKRLVPDGRLQRSSCSVVSDSSMTLASKIRRSRSRHNPPRQVDLELRLQVPPSTMAWPRPNVGSFQHDAQVDSAADSKPFPGTWRLSPLRIERPRRTSGEEISSRSCRQSSRGRSRPRREST